MSSTTLTDIPKLWRRFLIDAVFARNYDLASRLDGAFVAPNEVLERHLPSLLHIKAVAILDHALVAFIDSRGLIVPKKPYGTSLKGRIDFLSDQRLLSDQATLLGLKNLRNDL